MTDDALDSLLKRAAVTAMETCEARLRELGWTAEEIAGDWKSITARLKEESCKAVSRAALQFVAAVESKRPKAATTVFLIPFIVIGVRVAREINDKKNAPPVQRRWRRDPVKIDTTSIWWCDGGDTTATGGRMGS